MLAPPLSHREEYNRRKRKMWMIRTAIVFFLFVALTSLLGYIAHRQKIRISTVVLDGGVLVTQNDISAETLSFLSGSFFLIFPKDNVFLYPHDALMHDLKNHFPRIATLSITRKDFHTLLVTITERAPQALWCDTSPVVGAMEDGSTSEKCYFIDDTSTLFAEAPSFSGDAYFRYYGKLSTSTVPSSSIEPLGEVFMSSTTEFRDINTFVSDLRIWNLRPQYLVVGDAGEFTLVISGGGKIYFDMYEPLSKTADNLRVLLRTSPLIPSPVRDLPVEYIDLRFGNKLYYKLR